MAWYALSKALPEQQMFEYVQRHPRIYQYPYEEKLGQGTYIHPPGSEFFTPTEERMGTIHPAILGMMHRVQPNPRASRRSLGGYDSLNDPTLGVNRAVLSENSPSRPETGDEWHPDYGRIEGNVRRRRPTLGVPLGFDDVSGGPLAETTQLKVNLRETPNNRSVFQPTVEPTANAYPHPNLWHMNTWQNIG